MTQDLLKAKIVQFLRLTQPTEAKKIKNNMGLCFGLSICHAAMQRMGKLKWWEAGLNKIVHWDGDTAKLNKKVHLPGEVKQEALKEIFERVIKTVVYYQEGAKHAVGLDLFEYQKEILMPGKKILDTPIKKSDTFIGLFDADELILLFNKEEINNTICILSNSEHSITVEYQHPSWILYDPNYDHYITSKKNIYKRFLSKKDLIKEINAILGDIIVMKQVIFDDKENRAKKIFESLIRINPDIILCALPLFASEAPQYIPQALKDAMQCYEPSVVKNMLANILMTIYHTGFNWNGLHYIAHWAPNYLMSIIDYAAQSENGKQKMAKALAEKNSDGVTGLQMIKQYAPHCINRVNKILDSSESKKQSLHTHSIFNKKEKFILDKKENVHRYLR